MIIIIVINIDVCAISVHNNLWIKRISDLITAFKTIKTLLKVSQIFELRSLVLLQGTFGGPSGALNNHKCKFWTLL